MLKLAALVVGAACLTAGTVVRPLLEGRPLSSVAVQQSSQILPPILPTSPPGSVESVADLIGAWIYLDDKKTRAQIHELVWGVTPQGIIGLAVFRATDERGNSIDYRDYGPYERLAYSPAELSGGSYYKAGRALRVVEVSYRIDESGNMRIAKWLGGDSNGRPFFADYEEGFIHYLDGSDEFLFTRCCGVFDVASCEPHPTSPCSVDCPGPANCACSGTGSCILVEGPECLGECGEDGCPGVSSQTCQGAPPNCECT